MGERSISLEFLARPDACGELSRFEGLRAVSCCPTSSVSPDEAPVEEFWGDRRGSSPVSRESADEELGLAAGGKQ